MKATKPSETGKRLMITLIRKTTGVFQNGSSINEGKFSNRIGVNQ